MQSDPMSPARERASPLVSASKGKDVAALDSRNRAVHGAARLHDRQYRDSLDGSEPRRGTAQSEGQW